MNDLVCDNKHDWRTFLVDHSSDVSLFGVLKFCRMIPNVNSKLRINSINLTKNVLKVTKEKIYALFAKTKIKSI